MSAAFVGDIELACGHGWPGSCESTASAEEFLAFCVATGDTAVCPECHTTQKVTGPLRARGVSEVHDG